MGRKRKNGSDKLPPYVYLIKGRYVYRPYENGKLGKETRLCGGQASMAQVWRAYEAAKGDATDTFRWLGSKYMTSPEFRNKSPRTRSDDESMFERIIARRIKGGNTFGDLSVKVITPVVMRRYMDAFGHGREVRANRELSFMAVVFAWGYERGHCEINPCRGIRKFPEKSRTVYVSDEDYEVVYKLALKNRKRIPYIPIAMEIAFLCRARRVEVLNLLESDVTQEGLLIRRCKGSRMQVAGWTPRLRAAVDAALRLPGAAHLVPSKRWLIHDRHGNRITEGAFSTSWQRVMTQAVKNGLAQRFTFHDLKAKGVSDFNGDKKLASGHRSDSMVDVYDRKPAVVKVTR